MKKNRVYILLAALLLAAMPVFAGGNSAKSLAKQVQNLNKKAAELVEKAAGIEEKALALSDKDRRAYQAELERLGQQQVYRRGR
jgi:outer membrane murein-binding lipoprotein Lpp